MEVRDFGLFWIRLPRPFYLLGAATLAVALFWGGGQPFAVGLFPVPYDKLAHSVYFATLAVLLWFGTGGRWPVLVFLVVSAIGGLDELHQSTLPGRVTYFHISLYKKLSQNKAGCALRTEPRPNKAAVWLLFTMTAKAQNLLHSP